VNTSSVDVVEIVCVAPDWLHKLLRAEISEVSNSQNTRRHSTTSPLHVVPLSPLLSSYPLFGEITAQPKLTCMQCRSQPFRPASSRCVSITASKIYSNQNARNLLESDSSKNLLESGAFGISPANSVIHPPFSHPLFLARRSGRQCYTHDANGIAGNHEQ
jgi:hypothetical protein